MFYKDQLKDIEASFLKEFAEQNFQSSPFPTQILIYNDRFDIEVRDGIDEIYFTITEKNSTKDSHLSLRNYHSVSMMTKVVRMAFDEMLFGLNKVKSCGCPIQGSESHQEGCDLYRQNDYSKKIANQFTAKYEKDLIKSKSIAATQNASFNYRSVGEW